MKLSSEIAIYKLLHPELWNLTSVPGVSRTLESIFLLSVIAGHSARTYEFALLRFQTDARCNCNERLQLQLYMRFH